MFGTIIPGRFFYKIIQQVFRAYLFCGKIFKAQKKSDSNKGLHLVKKRRNQRLYQISDYIGLFPLFYHFGVIIVCDRLVGSRFI